MEISDLIAKLAKLQIYQNNIIKQLANRTRAIETETEDKNLEAQYRNPHRGSHLTINRWYQVQ